MIANVFVVMHLILPSQTTGMSKPVVSPATPPTESAAPAASMATENMIYSYNPFGKRDPFRSFLDEKGLTVDKAGDPLLNFDLSKFTLSAIIWGIPNPRALVVDGDSKGHVISRGTRIGRNRGQVTRILKDQVLIAEEYRDPLGKLMVSEFVMKLNTKEDQR